MFDRLLREVQRVARVLDPALLTAEQSLAAVDALGSAVRTLAHLQSLAAARVAETEVWRRSGSRSAEEDLARRTGTSASKAKEQLDTARRVRHQPQVDAAARSGRLSPEQTSAIASAAAADPEAEAGLVAKAERSSLRELQEECGRVKAAATDPEERHRRLKQQRRCRTYTDPDGGWNLHLRDTPDVGAAILEKLRPVQERRFQEARRRGEHEPAEAYAADAVVELLLADAGEGVAPAKVAARACKVIVRVDWDTLVRGYPLAGETCEIAGVGPVPVSVVKELLATGDPFLTAVLTRGVDIANVVHLGRKPTDLQVTALQWRDPICTVEGCAQLRWFEVDHRRDWADTKVTLLGWLDRLCRHHHALKTRNGWALVDGSGKRPMVPPDDRRHPRFSQMVRAG